MKRIGSGVYPGYSLRLKPRRATIFRLQHSAGVDVSTSTVRVPTHDSGAEPIHRFTHALEPRELRVTYTWGRRPLDLRGQVGGLDERKVARRLQQIGTVETGRAGGGASS